MAQNSEEIKKITQKYRYWGCIAYEESVHPDWIEILNRTGLRIAISPIHNRDIYTKDIKNEETGEILHKIDDVKKAHWHLIFAWDNPTTYNAAKSLCDKIKATRPEPIQRLKGNYDYLTHKNDPKKAQYNEEDLILLNGFNINDFSEMTSDEALKLQMTLEDLIINERLSEYYQLVMLAREKDLELYKYATTHTYYFNSFISSFRNGFLKPSYKQVLEGLFDESLPPEVVEENADADGDC